ncbi:hypothetical protein BpHYR1_039040 [Brachionus plicatilis]|uniref:Transmembrane protein n=1 Tax=Brachionus plicatilis TaxID=10195 RepID=A0A3M7R4E2_BRAPC|nr:hypothetical protein BpHYR1_039040 [Brachionus plicatilis]
MEKFVKKPSSKSKADLGNQEQLYQNQSKFDNNIYFSEQMKPQPVDHRNSSNLAHATSMYALTPSSCSDLSHKELLQIHKKEATVSFSFLFGAISLLTISLMIITLTFIFPFWIKLSFKNLPSNNSPVEVTNPLTKVILIAQNRTNDKSIVFNLGIWEVKMHQELEIRDNGTGLVYRNFFPLSTHWISSDFDNQIQSFVIKLLQFLELQNVNIFTIQILEILHLIFTFLTLCFTSFTLCLCTTHKSSLCWYLVCFLLNLIAFIAGLVVLILVVVWQRVPLSNLLDQSDNQIVLVKSLDWCFWLSVGSLSGIIIAAFLILLYILISTVILFNQDKAVKKMALNNPFIEETNEEMNASRLPRYQTSSQINMTKSSTTLSPAHQGRILQTCMQVSSNKLHNPSYIFYTGNGNYRKTNIDIDEIKPEYDQGEGTNTLNYSLVSQQKINLSHDHNYSNVEQPNNDIKLTTYR